ncbi:MAG: hypothetical protein GYA71_07055, partial [Bacteroidales bacterium]|nr:hypothetical protein [Bacteroidales bacterium]
RTPVNENIIRQRMGIALTDYLDMCIDKIESKKSNSLLNGLGEFVDTDLKEYVRTKLKKETIQLLKAYREFPILK